MSRETIRVATCLYCKGVHAYLLEVERARAMSVLKTPKKHGQPSTIKITSHFVCLIQDEHYEISFYLKDTAADRIRAVSVLGLVAQSS